MAYYSDGKHTFKSLLKKVKSEVGKAFLKYKQYHWYIESTPESECFVEQMLYNESAKEIRKELNGFIAGRWNKKRPINDVDLIMVQREIMPELAKIYKEMCSENSWDDEMRKEWRMWLEEI